MWGKNFSSSTDTQTFENTTYTCARPFPRFLVVLLIALCGALIICTFVHRTQAKLQRVWTAMGVFCTAAGCFCVPVGVRICIAVQHYKKTEELTSSAFIRRWGGDKVSQRDIQRLVRCLACGIAILQWFSSLMRPIRRPHVKLLHSGSAACLHPRCLGTSHALVLDIFCGCSCHMSGSSRRRWIRLRRTRRASERAVMLAQSESIMAAAGCFTK